MKENEFNGAPFNINNSSKDRIGSSNVISNKLPLGNKNRQEQFIRREKI
jgi:hypothetical protein